VAGSCEHGNEPLGSLKGREFLDELSVLMAVFVVPCRSVYQGCQLGDKLSVAPLLLMLLWSW
jgi:hypothetical protein